MSVFNEAGDLRSCFTLSGKATKGKYETKEAAGES